MSESAWNEDCFHVQVLVPSDESVSEQVAQRNLHGRSSNGSVRIFVNERRSETLKLSSKKICHRISLGSMSVEQFFSRASVFS